MVLFHVGLLHYEDTEWAEYVEKLLQKDRRQGLTVKLLNLQGVIGPHSQEVAELTTSCLVTLVLLLPGMLDFMMENTWLDDYFKTIVEHRVIANIASFIDDDSELESLKYSFKSSSKWHPLTLSNNTKANVKMVANIIDLVDEVEIKERQRQIKTPVSSAVREVIPSKVYSPGEKVAIMFNSPMKGTIQVGFTGCEHRIDTHKLNPYTYRFRTPDPMPKSNKLEIYQDSVLIGNKPINFITPNLASYQSVAFMMQCFGVDTIPELDVKLCDMFEKSNPADASLTTLFADLSFSSAAASVSDKPPCNYPTLLHYTAAHNLTEFTSQLLEAPGALTAYQIENQHGHNPADMAECNNHSDLALYIREFTDARTVADACNLYVHMIGRTQTATDASNTDVIPGEDAAELYAEAKSEDTKTNKLPPLPPSTHRKLSCGEIVHPVVRSNSSQLLQSEQPPPRPPRNTGDRSKSKSLPTPSPGLQPTPIPGLPPSPEAFLNQSMRILDGGAVGSASQQELIEIQKLVKNKEFTEDDALQLFKSWKQRPSTQSFRDRQKALKSLQEDQVSKRKASERILNQLKPSHRKQKSNKEPWCPIISSPTYDAYTPKINTDRASSISNSSSSSNGSHLSRDSSLSVSADVNTSDSEGDNRPPLPTRRRPSVDDGAATSKVRRDRRKSRKDMYLEHQDTEEKEEELPTLPPRRKPLPVPRIVSNR
ncbi:phosphoinositide 3-kinase adapter protein 1 [Patella vulgata]|uniref:phosphoinositide 3-kinase adapter protein 1 n=1 Tax=Patella vulgata TaxID=6465 RepID=UPI0024A820BB|nr:phosphoinositide 3-kinase adapter protein 1 [Patella vulgata]